MNGIFKTRVKITVYFRFFYDKRLIKKIENFYNFVLSF